MDCINGYFYSLLLYFRFVKSADKIFRNAEEHNMLGDEEKAYVFYMKFFNVISAVKKTADYKKNEVSIS